MTSGIMDDQTILPLGRCDLPSSVYLYLLYLHNKIRNIEVRDTSLC